MIEDVRSLQQKLLEIIKDFDSFCKENDLKYFISYGTLLGAVRHEGFIPWDDDFDIVMLREDYNKLIRVFKNDDKYTLQIGGKDYPLMFSKLRCNNSTFIEDIPYRRKYKKSHQGIFIDIFPLDNVYPEKLKSKLQVVCSNIVITQSLLKRGYSKTRISIKKYLFFILAFILMPFNKLFINIVQSANKKNCVNITSFYGEVKKVYLKKDDFSHTSDVLKFEDTYFTVFKNYKEFLKNMYGDYMTPPSKEQIDYSIHAKIVDIEKPYTEYLDKE